MKFVTRWAGASPGFTRIPFFTHQPGYPFTSIGEARFCAKLDDRVFDHLTVDANRNKEMATARDWDREPNST